MRPQGDIILMNQSDHANGRIPAGGRFSGTQITTCCRYAREDPRGCGFTRAYSGRRRYAHGSTQREVEMVMEGAKLVCERQANPHSRKFPCVYHRPA